LKPSTKLKIWTLSKGPTQSLTPHQYTQKASQKLCMDLSRDHPQVQVFRLLLYRSTVPYYCKRNGGL